MGRIFAIFAVICMLVMVTSASMTAEEHHFLQRAAKGMAIAHTYIALLFASWS